MQRSHSCMQFVCQYGKCLRNSILLRLRKPVRIQKYIKIGDQLISTDVIWIASEEYNSDWQLSIMQSLSATSIAATAVQKPRSKWTTHGAGRMQKERTIYERQKSWYVKILLLLRNNTFTPKEGVPHQRYRVSQVWKEETLQG